ncbi:MAG: CBS domain-containing protein [Myxococcota bacterium]
MREEPIASFMTPAPHAVGQEQTLEYASQLMREHQIRHLPVRHGGALVGVLSERDIALVAALDQLKLNDVTVEDAMTGNPYVVGPDAPLADVVTKLGSDRIGSALVTDETGALVGIFTVVDALRAFGDYLKQS